MLLVLRLLAHIGLLRLLLIVLLLRLLLGKARVLPVHRIVRTPVVVGVDRAVIVLGVLIEILCRDAVAGRGGIARERQGLMEARRISGLAELERVARGPVVILTFDPDAMLGFWLAISLNTISRFSSPPRRWA